MTRENSPGLALPIPGKEIEQSTDNYKFSLKKKRGRTCTHFIHRSNKYFIPQICGPDGSDINLKFLPNKYLFSTVQIIDGESFGFSNKDVVLGNRHTIWHFVELGKQKQRKKEWFSAATSYKNMSWLFKEACGLFLDLISLANSAHLNITQTSRKS